ncbi:hypothetical protein ACW9H6_03805 [Pseudomonas sp. SDO528_S397]
MAGKPFNKRLAADLIKDIRQAIGTGRKTSVLGSLELKINSWTSQEDNLLNALHREASWTIGERDTVPYAVSAEAHTWRFAASASTGDMEQFTPNFYGSATPHQGAPKRCSVLPTKLISA